MVYPRITWTDCCSATSCSAASGPCPCWAHPSAPGATPASRCRTRLQQLTSWSRAIFTSATPASPPPEEVSAVSRKILEAVLGEQWGCHTCFITRAFKPISSPPEDAGLPHPLPPRCWPQVWALPPWAIRSAASVLQAHFQRVVFHSGSPPDPGLSLQDFQTSYCELSEHNMPADSPRQRRHSPGTGGRTKYSRSAPGQYWDGGIIDYHFDLAQYRVKA